MCGVPQSDEFALHWYRAAAELGDPEGQFMLAVCYAQGIGIAQYTLGEMYELGEGVPQDDNLAAMWYNRAAAQGFTGE